MATKRLTEKQLDSINDCEHCECADNLLMYKIYAENSSTAHYQIGCSSCGARGPAMGYTTTAIEKWNYMMG